MNIVKFGGFVAEVYVVLLFVRGEKHKRSRMGNFNVMEVKIFALAYNVKQKPIVAAVGAVDLPSVFCKNMPAAYKRYAVDGFFLLGIGIENHSITAIFLNFFAILPIVFV